MGSSVKSLDSIPGEDSDPRLHLCFGSPAVLGPSGENPGGSEDPWLCVSGFRPICPYRMEDSADIMSNRFALIGVYSLATSYWHAILANTNGSAECRRDIIRLKMQVTLLT